jgi:hypothetical protein
LRTRTVPRAASKRSRNTLLRYAFDATMQKRGR